MNYIKSTNKKCATKCCNWYIKSDRVFCFECIERDLKSEMENKK